jgi:hypothetical protein
LPLSVAGQFYIDFGLNGNPLPLQLGGFDHFALTENMMRFMPCFRAVIFDTTNSVNTGSDPIQDGTPVTLAMGIGANDTVQPKTYNYRMFGLPKQVRIGNRPAYRFIGPLASFKYWRGIPKTILRGTSAQALTQIANDCGLTPDVVNTNDYMPWLLTRKPYSGLATHIADHGYVDDESVMAMALNTDGVLRYRNFATLAKQKPSVVFSFGTPTSGAFQIMGNYYMTTKSGLLNNIYKYGTQGVRENLDGSVSVLNKTKVTLLSNNLDINTDLYNEVGNVRNEHYPIDGGNTHVDYTTAEHQNRQGLAAFSTSVYVMTTSVVPLTLFDVAKLEIGDTGDGTAQIYNGNYIVAAKTRYVSGTQYYEKYKLITQGPQVDKSNSLYG